MCSTNYRLCTLRFIWPQCWVPDFRYLWPRSNYKIFFTEQNTKPNPNSQSLVTHFCSPLRVLIHQSLSFYLSLSPLPYIFTRHAITRRITQSPVTHRCIILVVMPSYLPDFVGDEVLWFFMNILLFICHFVSFLNDFYFLQFMHVVCIRGK